MPGPYKLGKRPPVHDDRTLRFSAYLTAALPAAPASVAYYQKIPSWPIYDNDKYGDCTCAAAGHMIQNWHKVTAFTALDLKNQTQAQSAVYLLGGIYIGVELPDSVVPPGGDYLTIPWVVPPGGPVGNAAPNPLPRELRGVARGVRPRGPGKRPRAAVRARRGSAGSYAN